MTSTANAETPMAPRQIRSARELRAALTAPDPPTRLGALAAIKAQPAAALAFGFCEGQDAIDLLIVHAHHTQGISDSEWVAAVSALSIFQDARVTAFFVAMVSNETEPTLLFAAARFLTASPPALIHAELRPLLLQDDCPARARAVAPLLASAPTLTVRERLRLALLAEDDEPDPPAFDEPSAEAWLAELDGAFGSEARIALEGQGEPAFAALVGLWDRLAEDTRAWLVRWGVRAFPARAWLVIEGALAADADRLTLIALEAVFELGEAIAVDTAALRRFVEHPDPALRRAAIAAGVTGVDWRRYLASDDDPTVRRACVPRLAEEEGLPAMPALLALLREPDWQMRAAVTRALIGLGEAVVEPVQSLVHDPDHGVRVAAVQVLLAFGQDAWLASHM